MKNITINTLEDVHLSHLSLAVQVSNRALEERKLRLTVFDVDRHRRHNVIGHAIYPLKEHNYDSNERVVVWRDLEREVSDVRVVISSNSSFHVLTLSARGPSLYVRI